VYQITQSGQRARDFALCKQMQRAAVSTMANLAEGYERGRPGELHQFVSIAKGACAEVRSHLYAARDAGYLDDETFQSVLNQAEETARLIGGFRVWAERRKQQEKG
jgi:four helix bundle protein